MAYFDNAATTYPKPSVVYDAMNEFYRHSGGNPGRGNYALSNKANKIIDDTRSAIQRLLHCPGKQVVFTPTATIALNIIIQGLIKSGYKTVYISPFEHNAVTRVLNYYEKSNEIVVRELKVNNDFEYDLNAIKYQFDEHKPDLLIVNHASNVTGLIAPVEDLFLLGKKYNAITVADMSQTAGLVDTDVGLETFDFAVFAGHKTLLGPTGISGFVMKQDLYLEPVLFGGTGFESANQDMPNSIPERYEMGTINILGIAGLNAAIKWIEEKGIDWIKATEDNNRRQLIEILKKYDFIDFIGLNESRRYVGIVSCVIKNLSSDEAASVFNRLNISVRTGLHCSPRAHIFLKTYPAGTIRFSTSCLTNGEDFAELEEALDEIAAEM